MARRIRHPELQQMQDVLNLLASRVRYNLRRTEHLVDTYKRRYGKGRGRRAVHETDLLRAAVVFLHATLEDFLRTVASLYLPTAGVDTLNRVPLVGTRSTQGEKYLLGRLVEHRGKTVDELIAESVNAHLLRSSFNHTREIVQLLESLGLVVTDRLRRALPDLQRLMDRRHQIVHRADRVETKGRGKQRAASINCTVVENWVEAVQELYYATINPVAIKELETRFAPAYLERLRKERDSATHAADSDPPSAAEPPT